MKLLVVGSMALDTVETPFGKEENVLGGSASYFSLAASMFTDVCIVAVVGWDFPEEHLELFRSKGIDLKGVTRESGETFKWEGRYGYDLGDPETLGTYLNVFQDFNPVIPEEYRDTEFVFLANIDPELQLRVLKQVKKPKLVACDTMNYWIENKPEELKEVIKHVDLLMLNDSESRILAGKASITQAARYILDLGPKVLIVKRGEYGALMFSREGIFWAPSYPLEDVIDRRGRETPSPGVHGIPFGPRDSRPGRPQDGCRIRERDRVVRRRELQRAEDRAAEKGGDRHEVHGVPPAF